MWRLLVAFIIGFPITVVSLNPIVVKGNLLYDSVTQERFFIKGVTYDPIPGCGLGISLDVLADDYVYPGGNYGSNWVSWREDLQEMAKFHFNAIRIYTTDPFKTHENFMKLAEELGFYVIVPLTGSDFGKLDALKSSPECYRDQLGQELFYYSRSIIKQLSEYPNMLLFEVGNELLNIYSNAGNGESFPCLKALIRDLHQFQTRCGHSMRRVPFVYSAEDLGSPTREYVGDFLTSLHESEDDVLDVMGINTYVYCADFHPWDQDNPYFELNEVFKNYATPVVFTEFGCPWGEELQSLGGRKFNMIPQMMNEMQETLSGGLVYEFVNHPKPFFADGFGLVTTKATTCSDDTATTWREDGINLESKFNATLDPFLENMVGTWTDDDRCSWTPPTTLEHRRPPVPDVSTMDADAVTWSFANWNDPLPPMPGENPVVECPDYPLSTTEWKENMCFVAPSMHPTHEPSSPSPTPRPTHGPTHSPSHSPTHSPSPQPSGPRPSPSPSASSSAAPSSAPSATPTHPPASQEAFIAAEMSSLVETEKPQGFTKAALIEVTLLAALATALLSTGVALLLKRRQNRSKEVKRVVSELVQKKRNKNGSHSSEVAVDGRSGKVMSHEGQDVFIATADVVNPFHSSPDNNDDAAAAVEENEPRPSWQPRVDGENDSRPGWQPEVSGFYV